MIISPYEAIERVARRTVQNSHDISQKNVQRRYTVVDLYGVEYTRQGDNATPASFYISVSPDLVYYHRFQFKLLIQPFVSDVSGATDSAVVEVNQTSLAVANNAISPNPHTHTTNAHNHNVVSGITLTHTTASDFRVSIEGIDITPYLAAQFDAWIDGEGVYPSLDIEKNYDILTVISDLIGEGRQADADKIKSPGYKRIEVTSSAPFQVTLVNYLKYLHENR